MLKPSMYNIGDNVCAGNRLNCYIFKEILRNFVSNHTGFVIRWLLMMGTPVLMQQAGEWEKGRILSLGCLFVPENAQNGGKNE